MSKFEQYLEAVRSSINEAEEDLKIIFRKSKSGKYWRVTWATPEEEKDNYYNTVKHDLENRVGHSNGDIDLTPNTNGEDLNVVKLTNSQKNELKKMIIKKNWKGISDYAKQNLI